jgi:nucleotide-binding universal stress UspA family protein
MPEWLPVPRAGVLVAVDGSRAAEAAVAVAARLAAARQTDLDVVHVAEAPVVPHRHPEDPLPGAVGIAGETAPGLPVRPLARTGPATAVLRDLARDYALVVLGSRGHGMFADAALGSHALDLAGAVDCPLVVVRSGGDRVRPGGPVVVALAGDGSDAAVLDFAFAEAALRGVALVAAHGRSRRSFNVGRLLLAALTPATSPVPADAVVEAVEEELVPWRSWHPDVEVHIAVRPGDPAAAVLDTARGASLLVLGSRGRGPRAGFGLGSVGQAVLHYAHCPVALVPGR